LEAANFDRATRLDLTANHLAAREWASRAVSGDLKVQFYIGPIATIVASIVAAGITGYFGWRQMQIAKQQAATALDQLRYNLFERRYAIYKNVQELIKFLANDSFRDDFMAVNVVPHYLVMDEARFFSRMRFVHGSTHFGGTARNFLWLSKAEGNVTLNWLCS
jgi:hypothetical protein